MTPWQTIFQQTMSSAGLEMPEAEPVHSRLAKGSPIAERDLPRRLIGRIMAAYGRLHLKSAARFWTPRMRVAQATAPEGSTPARSAIAVSELMRKLGQRANMTFRWLQEKGATKFASRRMRVAETVALGEKRFVSILQVDGQQFLIGSATGQITLLAVLDGEQGAAAAKVPSA